MVSQSLSRTLPRALSSALATKASHHFPGCIRSLASAAAALDPALLSEGGSTPLVELRRQLDTRDGTLLPNSLPYFQNKKAAASKRPACLTRDLVVLEYHCANQLFPSYTTGWLLDTPSKQPILVTCCHTLQETNSNGSPTVSGINILRQNSTEVIGCVDQVLTAWQTSDLLFLSPSFHPASSSSSDSQVELPQPLQANPYPPPVGEELAFYQSVEGKTVDTTLCLYTNPAGREVSPGTYAHLHAMDVAHLPSEGSSGGPLIDSQGRVVGIMRGRSFAYGQRRPYGFATPAERLWEVFKLF